MSTQPQTTDNANRQMRLTGIEKVQAAIWSLSIVFAVLSFVAILMWLQKTQFNQPELSRRDSVLPISLDDNDVEPQNVQVEIKTSNPGVEEFFEVETPQLAHALEAVTDVISKIRGQLAKFDGDADQMGIGDGRHPVPGFMPKPSETRLGHWSIEYEPGSIGEYVDQLTSFGVEIGFVSRELDRVEILTGLKSDPQIVLTTKEQERRIYFMHANSELRKWDLRLAQNAGLKPAGKIMVQLYPAATTARLKELETAEAAARGIDASNIKLTTFKVRATDAGYEYYVADIDSN